MKVSVIVTVYNRLEYLKNILICLNSQTVKPWEVIIADDGSNESVEEILENFNSEFNFKVKHVKQKDKGFRLAASRNNGALESEGDFLLFFDQDIIFGKTMIEEIKRESEKGKFLKLDGIYSTEIQKNKIQNKISAGFSYKNVKSELSDDQFEYIKKRYRKDKLYSHLHRLYLRKRGTKILGLAFGVFREDYFKVNGFDENYEGWGYEDDDFGNRLHAAGSKGRPVKLDQPIIHLYHPFDSTKAKSMNEEYYRKRKKEIFRKNAYRCEYGIQNRRTKYESIYKLQLK